MSDVTWARVARWGVFHAWRRVGRHQRWRTACGCTEGWTGPREEWKQQAPGLMVRNRCRVCQAVLKEEKAPPAHLAAGEVIAKAWPRAVSQRRLRRAHRALRRPGGLERVVARLVREKLVYVTQTEKAGNPRYVARRALVEQHGRRFGW